ncbi:hypothetical protein ILT44_23940 [Microvirga sp. BT689]|uniref:hypothetical protein n=1 Tax=Microvirga arvi TaxID=2778731 RepID=UPI00194DCB73|nr:hypothetical protein [Microvirga arvi]MBM6583258.1 hypothetical protein [Microvirga arvi]
MIPDEVKKGLEGAGISATSVERIRLAKGVVGKTSYVAGAALFALAVVGWSLKDPLYQIILAVLVVFVFIAYYFGSLWFANRHPGAALLEGAELIQWRQLEMSSKNEGALPSTPPTEPPMMIEGGE